MVVSHNNIFSSKYPYECFSYICININEQFLYRHFFSNTIIAAKKCLNTTQCIHIIKLNYCCMKIFIGQIFTFFGQNKNVWLCFLALLKCRNYSLNWIGSLTVNRLNVLSKLYN